METRTPLKGAPEHPSSASPEQTPRTPPRLLGGLDRTAVEVLGAVSQGKSIREIARALSRAPSSIHERLVTLGDRGLVSDGPAGRRLTPQGWQALGAAARGTNAVYRTPVRAHRFEITTPILRTPSQGVVREAFPEGLRVVRLKGWEKRVGPLVIDDLRVMVQLNLHEVVFSPDCIWDTPARAPLQAMNQARATARHLASYGFDLGSLTFRQPPEYAYVGHPAAHAWIARQQQPGAIWPDRMWVDNSLGTPELEVSGQDLAFAVEDHGWNGDLNGWLEALRMRIDAVNIPLQPTPDGNPDPPADHP